MHHQDLGSMMHRVGKCVIFARAWVLDFISWPVRNIKAAMQKLCISPYHFCAWSVPWSWDKCICNTDSTAKLCNGLPSSMKLSTCRLRWSLLRGLMCQSLGHSPICSDNIPEYLTPPCLVRFLQWGNIQWVRVFLGVMLVLLGNCASFLSPLLAVHNTT